MCTICSACYFSHRIWTVKFELVIYQNFNQEKNIKVTLALTSLGIPMKITTGYHSKIKVGSNLIKTQKQTFSTKLSKQSFILGSSPFFADLPCKAFFQYVSYSSRYFHPTFEPSPSITLFFIGIFNFIGIDSTLSSLVESIIILVIKQFFKVQCFNQKEISKNSTLLSKSFYCETHYLSKRSRNCHCTKK